MLKMAREAKGGRGSFRQTRLLAIHIVIIARLERPTRVENFADASQMVSGVKQIGRTGPNEGFSLGEKPPDHRPSGGVPLFAQPVAAPEKIVVRHDHAVLLFDHAGAAA